MMLSEQPLSVVDINLTGKIPGVANEKIASEPIIV